MKTISTLTICLFLIFNVSFAQYSQNFEGTTALTTGCPLVSGAVITTTTEEVISGSASLLSTPPVNGAGREYGTPYLNILSANFTVSFDYKLTAPLNGQATRSIEIGLQDKNGSFNLLGTILMNKDYDPIVPTSVTFASTTVTTGIQRLVLRMSGGQGDNARVVIDNLVASANTYYNSPVDGSCNSAPAAQNDTYSASQGKTFTALVSVSANDSDANGETLSAPVIVTPSPDGQVTMNADGTFTFTPTAGFTGNTTSFTYSVSDNGYDVASSTATVRLNFFSSSPLPVKLLSFSGSLLNKKPVLQWSVAENETGDHFEIEKSADGRTFTSIATLFTTNKIGTDAYSFRELSELNATGYYRLKIVNKDNSISFSKIVTLKIDNASAAASSLTIVQNPVTTTLQFQYTAISGGMSKAVLYNAAGVRVMSRDISLQKGTNALSLNLDNTINQGTYFLEISNGTERSLAKLIKK